jgi:tetratricopeptide (TPR) repeat protein
MEENQLAVSIDPTLVNSWENLAASQLRLGMIDECINSAETAIGLDPNTRLAYYSRGTCQIGLGNYTQALPDLEKYLAKTPADADGWYNLGIAKKFTDDIPGAILAYTKALQLDPKYYEANINRGNIYYDQGEYRKAVDDYTIALKQGDIVLAVQGRANSYYALGDYQHAIPDYEKLYALWPDKLCACGTLAQSYFEVDRYQDAIIAADTAIRLNPANDSLTKLLEIEGRSYYALGNYQNAIDYLTKAEKTLWYTYGFYYRGIAYQATGQKDKAILDLSNFLKWSDPSWTGQAITDSEYLHDLADAKARLKQLQP